jgi:hypothetical protein
MDGGFDFDEPRCGGDWLALMVKRGLVGAASVRAALEIRRVMTPGGGVGMASDDGLRAVDPSRLTVDGGHFSFGNLGAGAASATADGSVTRWDAFVAALVSGGDGVIKGRGKGYGLRRDILLVRLLVNGDRPRALDRELGVRDGTCQEAALASLRAYAVMHQF